MLCWNIKVYGTFILPSFLEDKRADLTWGMPAWWGHNVGPITEQRSGLGGGRVLIIGRIGSCKLSSFVSHSSVPRCLPGFLSLLRNHIHLTFYWDFSLDFTARERASSHNWPMINMIKYSHRWQYREDVSLCPWNMYSIKTFKDAP